LIIKFIGKKVYLLPYSHHPWSRLSLHDLTQGVADAGRGRVTSSADIWRFGESE